MKVLLMHPGKDFDLQGKPPWNAKTLVADLGLEVLIRTAAQGDETVHDVMTRALLNAYRNDVETVLFRQAVLRDAIAERESVEGLFALAVQTIEEKRRNHSGIWGHSPSSVLYSSLELMTFLLKALRRLRAFVAERPRTFRSEGFVRLFETLERELDDAYFEEVERHLTELRFRKGVLLSAELGPGNVGRDYLLHAWPTPDRGWLARLFPRSLSGYSFALAERDEAGAQALAEIRSRGLDLVANALAQAADHVDSFFRMLRGELAFYVGCLRIRDQLAALDEPSCFPTPFPPGARRLRARALYNACLSLQLQKITVPSDVDATGKDIIVVTGANQGGKSVFLRGLGIAQLMMQSGMLVGAESYEGELCTSVVTHFKREEDASLAEGKFGEELTRFSELVDHIAPNALVLLNESFAATNEREGSEIARQVVTALVEHGVKVVFVTFLHAFARTVHDRNREQCLFLRAERRPDGTRTFRLVEGAPLATSHARDLYRKIFADTAGHA